MNLLEGLIDEKTLKVIRLFFSNPDNYFHINKVSDETNVPLATTFRIINSLVKNDIIQYTKISKFKIYKMARNSKTKKMRGLI